ncbi:MAG: MMPL family transporter [Proteobacteria bacterium]|nr:MMPL family transporter [Pseudomonadota bacterium]
MSRRARLIAGAVAIVLLAGYVGLNFSITADVTHFLPQGNDVRLAKLSRALATSDMARTMVLLYEGDGAADRAADLAERLRGDERFERVVGGMEPDRLDAITEALFPYRYHLAPSLAGDVDFKARAAMPQTLAQRKQFVADPIGAWDRWQLKLAESAGGGLTIDDQGRLVTADGEAAVIFARTMGSPLRFQDAAPAVDALADEDAARTGAHFYAVGAERSIRADVRNISILSMLGIVLLFGLAFRSFQALGLAFLPTGVGVLAGLGACLLLWGRVHGLTLAFGASLLGVCVDYPVHLLSHYRATGDGDGAARHVRAGLFLGAGTTLAGFAGLVFTSFPGIREIAVFSAVGVAAALTTTLLLVPALIGTREPEELPRLMAAGPKLARARTEVWVLVIVAVAACVWTLPRLEWNDTVAALSGMDPDLQAQEARITARIARDDPGRLVVVFASDVESALPVVEQASERLSAAVDAGELSGFRALTSLLPSPATQAERASAVYGTAEAWREKLAASGLHADAFAPFLDEAGGSPPAPLTWAEASTGAAGELLRPHVLNTDDGGVVVLTWMRGLSDSAAVTGRLADLGDDVVLFEQAAFLDAIQADYRVRTTRLVLLGLFLVGFVLLLRYRAPRPAFAAFLPALLAAGTSLAVLAAFGVKPHLLHLASTLLVLSIGVDFGVFLVEHRDSERAFAASLRAIMVAAGTTVLSFGALAVSSQPALRAIGATAGVGVLLALVFAPAGLVLTRSLAASEAHESIPRRPDGG